MRIQLRSLAPSGTHRVALAGLLALTPVLLAGPAPAGTVPPLTQRVAVADVNLARPEGVALLYGRLRGAARTVCHPLESKSLHMRLLWRDCVHDAVDRAVSDFAHPALTDLHVATTQRSTRRAGIAARR